MRNVSATTAIVAPPPPPSTAADPVNSTEPTSPKKQPNIIKRFFQWIWSGVIALKNLFTGSSSSATKPTQAATLPAIDTLNISDEVLAAAKEQNVEYDDLAAFNIFYYAVEFAILATLKTKAYLLRNSKHQIERDSRLMNRYKSDKENELYIKAWRHFIINGKSLINKYYPSETWDLEIWPEAVSHYPTTTSAVPVVTAAPIASLKTASQINTPINFKLYVGDMNPSKGYYYEFAIHLKGTIASERMQAIKKSIEAEIDVQVPIVWEQPMRDVNIQTRKGFNGRDIDNGKFLARLKIIAQEVATEQGIEIIDKPIEAAEGAVMPPPRIEWPSRMCS